MSDVSLSFEDVSSPIKVLHIILYYVGLSSFQKVEPFASLIFLSSNTLEDERCEHQAKCRL